MNNKILNEKMKEKKLDVIYSCADQTRLWFTSFMSSAGFLFIENKSSTLFLDGRYIEDGKKNAKNVEIKLFRNKKTLEVFANEKKYKRIGIEKDYLNISQKNFLLDLFPNAELIEISGQKLRMIKSESEIRKIKKACKIALVSLEKTKHLLKEGTSEKEFDAELEKQIRLNGGEKGSFDAIVASGIRGALPHGRASKKIMKNGELITIDFGAIYNGFCSDITRTFRIGEVKNKKLLEIEKILREAQKLGIKSVKPGASTFDVDKVCRDYITQKGYGANFVHSTGHGLGIDVHEMPSVSPNFENRTILEPGMIITVEPGIYIEGLGGIRVEDDVLVTNKGCEVLSTLQEQKI